MRHSKATRRIVLVTMAVCLLCCTVAQAKGPKKPSGPSYDIVKLDDADGALEGFAHDINDARLIVGTAYDSSAEEPVVRAAYWTVTESRRSISSILNFLIGGEVAAGCNEAGEVVGFGGEAAIYWEDTSAVAEELPALSGDVRSGAEAISNDGVICGWSQSAPDILDGRRRSSAVVWRVTWGDAGPEIWGPLELDVLGEPLYNLDFVLAKAVGGQDNGVVTIAGDSNGKAVKWTVILDNNGGLVAETATILSNRGEANGVNNLGIVCGDADLEPALWIAGIPWVLDRGGVTGFVTAHDVNDNGVTVGSEAALWPVVWSNPDATMVRLDTFLRKSPFDSLNYAHAVSESGEIVGFGGINGTKSAFLAIPK